MFAFYSNFSDGGPIACCRLNLRILASRVVLTEWYALCGTALTLIISVYAFAGHRILDSQDQIFAEYAAIGHDRVELAKDTPEAKGLIFAASLSQVCDSTARPTDVAPKDVASPVRSASSSVTAAAEVVPEQARQTVAALRECSLYWRIKQNAANIAAVTLHMMSWSGVVINDLKVGEVFGINRAFILKAATEHTEYCQRLGLKNVDGLGCGPALQDIIYHTREVVDSLLGCIALYLLPTLYGGLGATAATLRALRRKVDRSLVTMTDRGRVQQDVILGVLCGAIIGLFFGYIGKANPQEGLGLSALALLAGYNISGVFSFLDELSNRVFQSERTGKTDDRQG